MKKNYLYNVTSQIIYQIVHAILIFSFTNLLILKYGSDTNGYVSSIQSNLNLLVFFEVGISLASYKLFYKPLLENDIELIKGRLKILKDKISKTIPYLILGLLCFTFINLLPGFNYLSLADKFIISIILSISVFIEFYYSIKEKVIFYSSQKIFIINFSNLIFTTLTFLFRFLIVYFHLSLILFFLAILISTFFKVFFLKISFKYYFFKILNETNNVDYRTQTDKIDNKSVFYHQIAGYLNSNFIIQVLRFSSDFYTISVYSFYSLVFTSLHLFISTLIGAIIPYYGGLLSKSKDSNIYHQFNNFNKVINSLIFTVYITAFMMFEDFHNLYFSNNNINYFSSLILFIFTISGITNISRLTHNSLLEAKGMYKETKLRAITEAIINIISSLLFFTFYGFPGLLLGHFLSVIFVYVVTINFTSKLVLKVKSIKVYLSFIYKILMNAFLYFILSDFIKNLAVNSFFQWILVSGVSFLITFLLNVFFDKIIINENSIFSN